MRSIRARLEALERLKDPPETLADAIRRHWEEHLANPGKPQVLRESFAACRDPLAERLRESDLRMIQSYRAEGRELHEVNTEAEAERLCASLPLNFEHPQVIVIRGPQ